MIVVCVCVVCVVQWCCCYRLHPPLPLLLICCSMIAGVAPPLPVKQRRTQSVMSEHSSLSRLDSRDDTRGDVSPSSALSQRHTISHSPAELTAALDVVLTQLNQATAPEKPPLNTVLRHTATTVTDTAPEKPPLNTVLSKHNHAAYTIVPQKPPVNSVTDATVKQPADMRVSSYDNLSSAEDSVDGRCHVTVTPCNDSGGGDVTSRYLMSSSHEMSHYTHTMCQQTTLTSASSVSASTSNADAPPLPVKKHSTFCCLVCLLCFMKAWSLCALQCTMNSCCLYQL